MTKKKPLIRFSATSLVFRAIWLLVKSLWFSNKVSYHQNLRGLKAKIKRQPRRGACGWNWNYNWTIDGAAAWRATHYFRANSLHKAEASPLKMQPPERVSTKVSNRNRRRATNWSVYISLYNRGNVRLKEHNCCIVMSSSRVSGPTVSGCM